MIVQVLRENRTLERSWKRRESGRPSPYLHWPNGIQLWSASTIQSIEYLLTWDGEIGFQSTMKMTIEQIGFVPVNDKSILALFISVGQWSIIVAVFNTYSTYNFVSSQMGKTGLECITNSQIYQNASKHILVNDGINKASSKRCNLVSQPIQLRESTRLLPMRKLYRHSPLLPRDGPADQV